MPGQFGPINLDLDFDFGLLDLAIVVDKEWEGRPLVILNKEILDPNITLKGLLDSMAASLFGRAD